MKKVISILSILLILAVLLWACAGEPEPTTVPTTEPTATPTKEPIAEPTTAPTTEPATDPTTVPTTEPQEIVPVWGILTQPTVEPSDDLTDVEYFQQLLAFDNGYEMNGYNAALNCTFEKPEDLDLNCFFWSHFDTGENWEDLTDEEVAYLNSQGLTNWFSLSKYSAKMMDAALREYFDLPLSAFQSLSMVYYEETDCYYCTGSSPLVSHLFEVTEVEYGEDGIVNVYYLFDPENEFMGKYVLTLQEKQGDGETGYYILSHLRIE